MAFTINNYLISTEKRKYYKQVLSVVCSGLKGGEDCVVCNI